MGNPDDNNNKYEFLVCGDPQDCGGLDLTLRAKCELSKTDSYVPGNWRSTPECECTCDLVSHSHTTNDGRCVCDAGYVWFKDPAKFDPECAGPCHIGKYKTKYDACVNSTPKGSWNENSTDASQCCSCPNGSSLQNGECKYTCDIGNMQHCTEGSQDQTVQSVPGQWDDASCDCNCPPNSTKDEEYACIVGNGSSGLYWECESPLGGEQTPYCENQNLNIHDGAPCSKEGDWKHVVNCGIIGGDGLYQTMEDWCVCRMK